MATVELTIRALPAHVRTARLVATAVARRSGVAEAMLDEVRLAVGEACSRAVAAHRQHCPQTPIQLELRDERGRFEVLVADAVPEEQAENAGAGGSTGSGTAGAVVPEPAHSCDPLPAGLGLAVISGLADHFEITSHQNGVRVSMSWPASTSTAGDASGEMAGAR